MFPNEWFRTEAKENSEMAYCIQTCTLGGTRYEMLIVLP